MLSYVQPTCQLFRINQVKLAYFMHIDNILMYIDNSFGWFYNKNQYMSFTFGIL
jgi:hypothetical protein